MSHTARPARTRPRANPRGHVVREPASSPFPPIADYAFLSDCHTGALLAPDGTVEWLCVPRFDAPSVFGSILGKRAGSFRLAPLDSQVPAARRYLHAVDGRDREIAKALSLAAHGEVARLPRHITMRH